MKRYLLLICLFVFVATSRAQQNPFPGQPAGVNGSIQCNTNAQFAICPDITDLGSTVTVTGALAATGGGSFTGTYTFLNGLTVSGSSILANGGINASLTVASPQFLSSNGNSALSGTVRLNSTDTQCWRNNANSADLCLSKNASDNLLWPNSFSIGGTLISGGGGGIATLPNNTGTLAELNLAQNWTANQTLSNTSQLRFLSTNGTNYAGFQGGASTTNLVWILPTTDSTGTQCISSNGSQQLAFSACSGGTGTPGGSSTHVQYNSSGTFAGSADLTWTNATAILAIGAGGSNVGILQLWNGISPSHVSVSAPGGTYNFLLPATAGTAGQPLLSGGGGVTAQTYGTLQYGGGGTGGTSYSTNQLVTSGASAFSSLAGTTTGTNPILKLQPSSALNTALALDTAATPTGDILDVNVNTVKTSWFDSGAVLHTPQTTYTGSGPLTLSGNEGTCPAPAVGQDIICLGDSGAHVGKIANNGATFKGLVDWVNDAPTGHGVAIVGSTFPQLNFTGAGASGFPLVGQGAAADPIFTTLGVAGGGTGDTTLTAHGVLLGEGTSAIVASAAGTSGQGFLSGGASADGAYGALNLAGGSSIFTGILPIANGGTGASTLAGANIVTVTGAITNGHCASFNAPTVITDSGIAGCGGAGSAALSAITAATGTNSINNGVNPQTWNWALTGSTTAFKYSENSAATGSNNILLQTSTQSGSTAIPFQMDNNGNGLLLSSTGVLNTIGSGKIDLSAATASNAFRIPVGAGLTSGLDGALAYDSTNKSTHLRTNGADSLVAAFASAPAGGACVQTNGVTGLVVESATPCETVITTDTTYYIAPAAQTKCEYDGDQGTTCTPSDSNTGTTPGQPWATDAHAQAVLKNKALAAPVHLLKADTTGPNVAVANTCYQPTLVEFSNPSMGSVDSTIFSALASATSNYPQGYIDMAGVLQPTLMGNGTNGLESMTGTVSTNGTTTVTYVSGFMSGTTPNNQFQAGQNWNGVQITINGTAFTIASVASNGLTLTTTVATGNNGTVNATLGQRYFAGQVIPNNATYPTGLTTINAGSVTLDASATDYLYWPGSGSSLSITTVLATANAAGNALVGTLTTNTNRVATAYTPNLATLVTGASTCTGTSGATKTAYRFLNTNNRVRGLTFQYFEAASIIGGGPDTAAVESYGGGSDSFIENDIATDTGTNSTSTFVLNADYSHVHLGGNLQITNATPVYNDFFGNCDTRTPFGTTNGFLSYTIESGTTSGSIVGFGVNVMSDCIIWGPNSYVFLGTGAYDAFHAQDMAHINSTTNTSFSSYTVYNNSNMKIEFAGQNSTVIIANGAGSNYVTYTSFATHANSNSGSYTIDTTSNAGSGTADSCALAGTIVYSAFSSPSGVCQTFAGVYSLQSNSGNPYVALNDVTLTDYPFSSLSGGSILVSGQNPFQAIHIGANQSQMAANVYSNTNAFDYFAWSFSRSRGTTAGAHGAVQSGDGLGGLLANGDDGTANRGAAQILYEADGNFDSTHWPARIRFLTRPNSNASLVEHMRLDSTAGLKFKEETIGGAPAGFGSFGEDSTAHEYLAATNGSASTGMMVRVQPGAVNSTANTGAISTATLCASAAGACNQTGQYKLHFNFIETGTACAVPGTGGVTFLLTWTDDNGTAHSAVSLGMDDASAINAVSQTFHFQTSLGAAWASGDFTFSTNGSVVQYATGYTACGTGTGQYTLRAAVERLQ